MWKNWRSEILNYTYTRIYKERKIVLVKINSIFSIIFVIFVLFKLKRDKIRYFSIVEVLGVYYYNKFYKA